MTKHAVALCLLGTALLLLAAPALAQKKGKGVEFSSSAILFYNCEFEPHYGQPISQCSLLLRRAKEQGGKKWVRCRVHARRWRCCSGSLTDAIAIHHPAQGQHRAHSVLDR